MNQHFNELIVKELSLVDRAANKEKFLLYKSEEPPKLADETVLGILLNSDLESLEKMVATVHELVNRMLQKTTKKGYEYPYPDGKKMSQEEEQAKKKEEEEAARKKKEEEEKIMTALRAENKELEEYKKTVDDLLPALQQQIEEFSAEAILAEAKKM